MIIDVNEKTMKFKFKFRTDTIESRGNLLIIAKVECEIFLTPQELKWTGLKN